MVLQSLQYWRTILIDAIVTHISDISSDISFTFFYLILTVSSSLFSFEFVFTYLILFCWLLGLGQLIDFMGLALLSLNELTERIVSFSLFCLILLTIFEVTILVYLFLTMLIGQQDGLSYPFYYC